MIFQIKKPFKFNYDAIYVYKLIIEQRSDNIDEYCLVSRYGKIDIIFSFYYDFKNNILFPISILNIFLRDGLDVYGFYTYRNKNLYEYDFSEDDAIKKIKELNRDFTYYNYTVLKIIEMFCDIINPEIQEISEEIMKYRR